jgi:hypothetical protein
LKRFFLFLPAFFLLSAAWGAPDDSGGPVLTYIKTFPGSTPPYVEIDLMKDGAGTYQEAPQDEDPLHFQLSGAEWTQIQNLAGKLDHFSRPLESGLKVANMGMKTFRYTGPGGPHEVKFNYSEDADARALNEIFDSIMDSERARIDLETAVRFDKLGAQNAILRLEVLRDQKRLMSPQQFLPMLDRVAKNESFLHIARERAATLAENIRKTSAGN